DGRKSDASGARAWDIRHLGAPNPARGLQSSGRGRWPIMEGESIVLLGAALGSCRAARRLLRGAGSLRRALEMRGDELSSRYGVRPARAVVWDALRRLRDQAALEAAARGAVVGNPRAVHAVMAPIVEGLRREVFFVLPVDARLRLVCPPVPIARGGPDA